MLQMDLQLNSDIPQKQLSLNEIQLIVDNDTERQPMLHEAARKRKEVTLFILNCIFIVNAACLNIMFFFTDYSQAKFQFIFLNVGCISIFFLFNSIYCSKSVSHFFCLMFLIDSVLLNQIVADIGFVGMIMVNFDGDYRQYLAVFTIPFLNFLLSGNIKLSLLNYQWTRIRTIALKLALLTGTIILFGIGAYIMFINFKITNGYSPKIDVKFKDFTLLYTFGNFAFYAELYNKVSDFDKTSDLQFGYEIVLDEEESQSQKNPKNSGKQQNSMFQNLFQMKKELNESKKIQQGSQNKIFLN